MEMYADGLFRMQPCVLYHKPAVLKNEKENSFHHKPDFRGWQT